MRRFLARLWLYLNCSEFCWEHTERYCNVCARRRAEADQTRREADRRKFLRMLRTARGNHRTGY